MNNHTLTISVARIPLKVVFKQKAFFSRIKKAYHRFLTNGPADLCLEVEITEPGNLADSFGPGLRSPALFACSEEAAFDGSLDLKKKKGKLLLANKRSMFFFFNFIRGLYCYLIYQAGGILLHASVIAKKNKACVFFGPSGSGKTTITKLSRNYTVIGDDFAVIKKREGGFYTFVTPWPIPNLRNKPFKPFKIAALFKPIKDREVYLERVRPSRALAEVYTFIAGMEKRPKIYHQLLQRHTDLIENVPCYRLHFRKDNSFWKEVDTVIK